MKASKKYSVILNGRVWSNHMTEIHADAEAIRCRQLGLGIAYVVRE